MHVLLIFISSAIQENIYSIDKIIPIDYYHDISKHPERLISKTTFRIFSAFSLLRISTPYI